MTARAELPAAKDAARALLVAEERIDLTGRLAPRDVGEEVARVARACARGERFAVTWQPRPAPELLATQRALEAIALHASELGPLGHLYAGRASELLLEARLVEALGTPRFHALAAERFPEPPGALARACEGFVAEALALPDSPSAPLHRSDDEADAASLVSVVARRARELGLAVRIRVSRSQLATAATGDGLVVVRAGVQLRRATAERIASHELLAHALPRARARHAAWSILRAGTAAAADHEEGRALLIERRAGLLDPERQRELAWRHQAALGVRQGAEPHDTLASLVELGAPPSRAVELVLRVQRGGGLARELVYLPSLFALAGAFAEDPSLERWFERGRVSLDAARELNRALAGAVGASRPDEACAGGSVPSTARSTAGASSSASRRGSDSDAFLCAGFRGPGPENGILKTRLRCP